MANSGRTVPARRTQVRHCLQRLPECANRTSAGPAPLRQAPSADSSQTLSADKAVPPSAHSQPYHPRPSFQLLQRINFAFQLPDDAGTVIQQEYRLPSNNDDRLRRPMPWVVVDTFSSLSQFNRTKPHNGAAMTMGNNVISNLSMLSSSLSRCH